MRRTPMEVPVKALFMSPIGPVEVEVSGGSVTRIDFARRTSRKSPEPAAATRGTVRQLDEYFKGTRRAFDLEPDLEGTTFQEDVWRALVRIPYGETRTYGGVAKAVGRPGAARAVGAACGANPVSIVVPCHRVVGSGGELVGYGGGLWRKKWLLEHEANEG